MRFDLELATPGTNQAQNASFGLKSGLSGELVISRSSSAHIFRGSLPFMFMRPTLYLYFSFYSLTFSCNITLSLLFIHSSVYYPVVFSAVKSAWHKAFLSQNIPETRFLSLVFDQDANFHTVCLFLYLGYHAACRFLVPSEDMNPVWTLYSMQAKGRILTMDSPRSPWFR